MPKRVWILGAGFSRPLGGPLLNELMRPEVRGYVEACFPKEKYSRLQEDTLDFVLQLYAYGSKFRDGQDLIMSDAFRGNPGELVWSDAEQFLDYLDTAFAGGPDSPAFKRIDRLCHIVGDGVRNRNHKPSDFPGSQGVWRLAHAAKRLVAGSCAGFLERADPSTERWEPFLKWARSLKPDDTIISFNYDCVPELLNRQTDTISTVRLNEPTPQPTKAQLLKLHGSVNWQIKGMPSNPTGLPTGGEAVEVVPREELEYALMCKDHELAIASPGPIKKAVSAGWLAGLWNRAEVALKEADAIVFIGYRFPPSDSHSRERLLRAISQNQNRYLAVHTVLGLSSPDAPRLEQLLRFALASRTQLPNGQRPDHADQEPRYTLHAHPLYGEDFLSVFPEGWITQAWQLRR